MKRIVKRLLIFLLAVLFLFALFLIAWVFLLFPHFGPKADETAEYRPEAARLAEESEFLGFNEENGVLYVNNEIVIFIRESATQAQIDEILDGLDAEVDESMADILVYRLIFREAKTYEELEALLKDVRSNVIVENAYLNTVSEFEEDTAGDEDDFDYQEPIYPSDTWNNDAWNAKVPRGENWGMEAIDAPGAWGYLDQMNEVRIGLIDAMPKTDHEDLKFSNYSCLFVDGGTGRTAVNQYSVSSEDHGTHVSGTMNAEWDNKKGVSGVMGGKGRLYYGATYYVSKGKIVPRYATAYSYLLALKTLIDQDVQVINISQNTSRLIGFAASHGNQNAINYLSGQAELTEKALLRIISAREADNRPDFVICVAAGNSNSTYYYKDEKQTYGYREGMTNWESVKYLFGWRGEIGDSLALYNNFLNLMDAAAVKDRVIVVGAVGIDSKRSTAKATRYSYASFSNVGSRVDVAAPGCDVYSCVTKGYASMSGTSMATPHVSGVAGLVFACNPSLTGPEVKEILRASTMGRYYYTGGYSGLVNANAAVVNALQTREETVERVLKTDVGGGLDLCFVVDTTGSMGDDIDNAKENMADILAHLAEKTEDYRVALIDYRDFSSRSRHEEDYPCRLRLDFTNDNEAITGAINALDLGNGGDEEETVYSALMAAVKLEWRSDAKKAIIIMGDAAPLDPEPKTDYTYEDVLLALFNADISLDYEDSDERVVAALDTSLISVFSIGTDASASAEDFFEEISESTGGSYVGVDDASKVGDAIIDSIEQIEIAEKLSVNADFGDELSNEEISLYSDENEFLFMAETDEEGRLVIDNVEADTYHWKCDGLYAGGTLTVSPEERDASVRVTQTYWFTPLLQWWRQHRIGIWLIVAAYLCPCILFPVGLGKLCKRVRKRRLRKAEKAKAAPENVVSEQRDASEAVRERTTPIYAVPEQDTAEAVREWTGTLQAAPGQLTAEPSRERAASEREAPDQGMVKMAREQATSMHVVPEQDTEEAVRERNEPLQAEPPQAGLEQGTAEMMQEQAAPSQAAWKQMTPKQAAFCGKCGARLKPDAKFCGKCGARVEDVFKQG